MAPIKIDDIAELQEQIFKLEDEVVALKTALYALVLTLHGQGIPLQAEMLHRMNGEANHWELDGNFPEPAKAIDEIVSTLSRLLSEQPFPARKNGAS